MVKFFYAVYNGVKLTSATASALNLQEHEFVRRDRMCMPQQPVELLLLSAGYYSTVYLTLNLFLYTVALRLP